ncbi:hypothetical protein HDV05_004815 [Chytridiales sp. JEL 0842]|nr:hypothetical protein HDV05_004815 [Chytridiales sp. JEL 0842]
MALAQTPQKRNVIRIGFVLPFDIPFNGINDTAGAQLHFISVTNTIICYNTLLWYAEKINNDTSILPDTRIEFVPMNSAQDRGTTLNVTLDLALNRGVASVIGEAVSRNTVTMAVAASVNNILQCVNLAATPQLSNKNDYPTTFRSQSSAIYQAKAFLALVNSFNITTCGVLAPNDEFGAGIVEMTQRFAPQYNITIQAIVTYDVRAATYEEQWAEIVKAQVQTVFLVTSQTETIRLMATAQRVGLLDGSMWIIGSLGWDMYTFATQQALLRNLTGLWQISAPRYWDDTMTLNAGNRDAKEAHDWWNSLWVPNTAPSAMGFNRDFNPRVIFPLAAPPQVPPNCRNDSWLDIIRSIPRYPFISNNMTLGAQGDQCTQNGKYPLGYMYMFAQLQGYGFPTLTENMWSTLTCGRMLIGLYDSYIKSGKITADGINARRLMSLASNNITRLLNEAQIPDWSGDKFVFDNGGDVIPDQNYRVYVPVTIVPNKTNIFGVNVGNYNGKTEKVTFYTRNLTFLNGMTAPPPPRTVPRVPYQAKMGIRYGFDALVGVCSLFTLALFVYMLINVKVKIFVASSPRFLTLIVIGANISFIGVWLFSQYPMSDGSCVVFGWLKYMGFATVFGALILKTYRIAAIFGQKKNRKSVFKLDDTTLFIYFTVFVALWASLMIIWTVIPTQRPYLKVDTLPILAKNGTVIQINTTPYCHFGDFNYVNLGAMILTLAFGVLMTVKVRNTPSAFNESKFIAMALYNWVILGVVLNGISNFAVTDPDIVFIMEALVAIITQTGVVGLLFVPKIIEIRAGRGDQNSTFQSSSAQSGSSHGVASHTMSANNLAEGKKMEDLQSQLKTKDAQIEQLLKQLKEKDALLATKQKE